MSSFYDVLVANEIRTAFQSKNNDEAYSESLHIEYDEASSGLIVCRINTGAIRVSKHLGIILACPVI